MLTKVKAQKTRLSNYLVKELALSNPKNVVANNKTELL